MSHLLRATRSIFVILVTLALALLLSSASHAQDTGPDPVVDPNAAADLTGPASVGETAPAADLSAIPPGGPGSFSLTALAMQPYPNQTVPYTISGRTLYNPDTSLHYYEAPVYLPQGATITRFVVWYTDNSTSNMWAALARGALDDTSVNQIGRVDSIDAAAGIRYLQDTTITFPVVNNESYMYWIEVSLPPNNTVGVLSFRIDYQYSGYMPMINK